MLNLINYEDYHDYVGNNKDAETNVPSDLFNKYCLDSCRRVVRYTSNRVNKDNITKDIKDTICQIMDLLYSQDKLIAKLNDDKATVASETVGPHSKSYVNKTSLQEKRILSSAELDRECYRICYNNLVHTGLMFRGSR